MQVQLKVQPNISKFKLGNRCNCTLAAGTSTLFLTTGFCPVERVKLLLQNQDASTQISSANRYNRFKSQYKGITDCFTRVIKEQGFFSLWRGNMSAAIRYFPSRAWCLSVFNYCKQYSDNSLLQNMIVGAFAGSTEAVIFYPLTFTRTRLGVDVGRGKEDRQFTNTLDCFKKIIKNDGFKGLYRGLWVSLVLISLTKSTYFGFYESAKRNLDCYRDKSYHLVLIWMLAILSILVLVI